MTTVVLTDRFTFHHVSIKTNTEGADSLTYTDSHSTMYLLKPRIQANTHHLLSYSHSTMYLLKLYSNGDLTLMFTNSHSTMYLLKLR